MSDPADDLYWAQSRQMYSELAKLEAEIERLRAAHKEIKLMPILVDDGEHGFERAFLRCKEISSRALDGEKG